MSGGANSGGCWCNSQFASAVFSLLILPKVGQSLIFLIDLGLKTFFYPLGANRCERAREETGRGEFVRSVKFWPLAISAYAPSFLCMESWKAAIGTPI